MLDNVVGPPLLCDGDERTRTVPSYEALSKMPFEDQIDITTLLSASFNTTSPAADIVQGEDISNEHGTSAMVFASGSRMAKQLDVRMWEVIQKEITDCHESSHLNRLRGYSNVGT